MCGHRYDGQDQAAKPKADTEDLMQEKEIYDNKDKEKRFYCFL